jgi:SAM-dependent methyltransferase
MSLSIIAKGLVSFVLPPSLLNRSGGRTHAPRYCYSVLLRHLAKLHAAGIAPDFRIVAEIGPGRSIGTGLAALAAGADRYFGFDIKDYGAQPDAAAMFDAIAALFGQRAPVPGGDEFPTIKPVLDSDAFPADVLSDARLNAALAPDRLDGLRARLAEPATNPVQYRAPWFDADIIEPGSVDWIFSQAVMEHVDDLLDTYAACRDWLAPGGVMTHQIDFKSHGTADAWNGHWAYGDATWRVIRGGRLYLINRQPMSAHVAAMERAGFDVVSATPVVRDDGLPRDKLARRFRTLSDDDLKAAGAFIIARRRETPQ